MTRQTRRRLQQVAGSTVGALCLAWLLHGVPARDLAAGLRSVDWALVALAVVVDVASYVCQGVRWSLLLRPVGSLNWVDATRAIYTGLFASELLPMRPGELVRAYVASRILGRPVAAVAPSILAERLFDGIWLAAGLGVTALVVPLPRRLAEATDIFGVLILLLTALFLVGVVWMRKARPSPVTDDTARVGRSIRRPLRELANGLAGIGARRESWVAFVLSGGLLAGQVLAFWLVMRACGLLLSIWVGAAVLFVVHLATAVPNAPANVGTYQVATVLGLTLFEVDKTVATGFSMVVFVVLTLPLWLLGYAALISTNLSLGQLRAETEHRAAQVGAA